MLKILQPGIQPLGQFDGLDSELFTLKGGEVVTFGSTPLTSGDAAAADVFDGYQNPTANAGTRTVVQLCKTALFASRPLMLSDDGVAGYGTLFGQVVGGAVGKAVAGANLGIHSAAGSGKVTCWDKPGLYAVTLDALDSAGGSLLDPKVAPSATAGTALRPNANGVLTGAAGGGPVVARFVEFSSGGSLVNTAAGMSVALTGGASFVNRTWKQAVIHFNPVTT